MQGRSVLGWIAVGLLTLTVLLLATLVFQLDTLEERLILQARQLRALGESSDRVAGRLDRLTAGGGIATTGPRARPEDAYADVQLHHPELPNFLEANSFSYANYEAPQDKTLLRGWPTGDPKGFNPLTENSAEISGQIEHYVASTMARSKRWSDPDRWTGDLAWRVEISDDSKELTIYLRRGVKWHRPGGVDLGDPRYAWLAKDHEVTAHDVVFMFKMMMHPQVENGFIKGYFSELESWEALDDYTVRVRWKKKQYDNITNTISLGPLPEFLYAYDESGERFPEEAIGLRFNQHWYNNKGLVGSGPYRMTSYEPGVQIQLERNEDYYGEKPAIKRIVYPIYTDPNRTLLMLKAREIHAGPLRPAEYREEILRWKDRPQSELPKNNPFLNGEIECKELLRFAYTYVGWNADKAIFSDKRVRRAMTLAMNRQQIIDEIYVGLGVIATGPNMSTSPYNDPDVPHLGFDLEAAAALLAEAGWTDSDQDGLVDKDLDGDGTPDPFDFTLLIGSSQPESSAMATVFKEDLLKIGVRMGIESAEWSLMQKRMDEKQFDAFLGGWLQGWEGDPYQLWHSSQADVPKGSNKVGFRRKDVDRWILELRETFDREERIEKYRQIHRAIYDEQAYTFFRVPKSIYCWWAEVKGVRFPLVRPQIDTLPWWIEES